MLGALSAPLGKFSPLLGQVFPGTAVSPIPTAPLCWAFCLPPGERVGPAGFCAQGLGVSWSEPVLQLWSPSGQPGCSSGFPLIPSFRLVGLSIWATDQGAHPPEVSGVGAQTSDWGARPPGV